MKCRICRELLADCDVYSRTADGPVCVECINQITSPQVLKAIADWFDDPHVVADIVIQTHQAIYTPGMLLRRIAEADQLANAHQTNPDSHQQRHGE